VGEGAVRAYLAARADVVVPTRDQQRADEFRALLGEAATGRLHLVVHDYTTFAGAEALAAITEDQIGAAAVAASAAAGVAGQPLRLLTRAGADDTRTVFRGTR
jgi:NAD(P)-dependent dehydrogenase (short-subunit alcohol dehydrogenase family)